jgi:hypothetical protein
LDFKSQNKSAPTIHLIPKRDKSMLEELVKDFPTENGDDRNIQQDHYSSVEIRPDSLIPIYKFRLRKSSSNGAYILVKESSVILSYLKSGQKLNVDYHPLESTQSSHTLKTKISYTIKKLKGRFKGHHMVGLSAI